MITTRRMSITPSNVYEVTTSSKTENWEVTVSSSPITYAFYRFVLPTIDGNFGGAVGAVTVKSVEFEYWHYGADGSEPIKNIQFVRIVTNDPATAPHLILIIEGTSGALLTTQEIHGTEKVKQSVTLGSSSSDTIYQQLTSLIASSPTGPFSFCVRRATDATAGTVQLGGNNLKAGLGEIWQEETGSFPVDDPILTITWDDDGDPTSLAEFDMFYTTADPSTSQQTPVNSIGGYAASNEVYTKTQIGGHVGATQTTISLNSSGSLPDETSGLAQIGPEIVRYGNVDSTNYLLLNVQRGIAPDASFPASSYPTNDFVHFLEVDKLFNTRPTSGLIQYRCVAIKLVSDVIIQSPKVFLRQNPNAQVVVDIGIEVPAFDRHSGLTVGWTNGRYFQSDSADVLGFSSDYFLGAHVIMRPDSSPVHTIVTSYDHDGSIATFLVEDSISQVDNSPFRINPAPCYRANSDVNGPTLNSGRFLGFLSEGGSNEVVLEEQDTDMRQHDLFYLWIKRTLTEGSRATLDSGAVIMLRIDASSIS